MNKTKIEKKSSGTLSLVFGIISVFPGIFLGPIGTVLSILTIIFGSVQFHKKFGKISLVLGIVSLIINILLMVLLFTFITGIIQTYEDVQSLSYDEGIEICKSRLFYYEKTLCLGSLINSNQDNTEVVSGEVCKSFPGAKESAFCYGMLAKKFSNEEFCLNLQPDLTTMCIAIVKEDPTLCEELQPLPRSRCLDLINSYKKS